MPFIKDALNDAYRLLGSVLEDGPLLESLDSSITKVVEGLQKGGKVLACGNGGSMCDSLHFVQELTGRYRKDRSPISAIALGGPAHITCVGNDYGFDYIFSRQVEALGKKDDCLLAISTSGNSKNVILAVKKAKELGVTSIGLLGKQGGELKSLVDIPLVVSHPATDRIQEIHIKLIHIFIEGIERNLFPNLYS